MLERGKSSLQNKQKIILSVFKFFPKTSLQKCVIIISNSALDIFLNKLMTHILLCSMCCVILWRHAT